MEKKYNWSKKYDPNSKEPYVLSRSKIDLFLNCKRCFYLERKLKIKSIGMPGYPINSRVDALLKTEFDIYRDKQEPHPIFTKYKLNFALSVPSKSIVM